MAVVPTNYGFWEDWLNPQKVTFDGPNKLILVNYGELELDVGIDIYSAWKEWLIQGNGQYLQAFRTVGGDPIGEGRALGGTYFLMNGWRIRTWEGDHRLVVKGNLYTEEGVPPFVPTLNPWTIAIESTVSNLIDRIDTDVDVLIDQAAWAAAKISPDIIFVNGRPYVKISDPDIFG